MKNFLRLTHFLGLFLVALSPAVAQPNSCPQRLIPVVAVSPEGEFLGPLEFSDVKVSARSGAILKASALQPDTRPRRIVILLDVSASMQGRNGEIWKLVSQFVRDLASPDLPNVRFALVLFSDHIIETTNFSDDRMAADKRLKAISADPSFMKREVHGTTAIYDAIEYGYKLLEKPTSADALVVITDGYDNRSRISAAGLQHELSRTSTRVFAILFDLARFVDNSRMVVLGPGPTDLTDFANKTGGDVFGPMAIDDLGRYSMADDRRALKPLPYELKEFYKQMLWSSVLAADMPYASFAVEPQISLSHSGREKWKGATLHYPRLIGDCEHSR